MTVTSTPKDINSRLHKYLNKARGWNAGKWLMGISTAIAIGVSIATMGAAVPIFLSLALGAGTYAAHKFENSARENLEETIGGANELSAKHANLPPPTNHTAETEETKGDLQRMNETRTRAKDYLEGKSSNDNFWDGFLWGAIIF